MDTGAMGLVAERLDVRIGAVEVCRGLGMALMPGSCWALLGRNGAGKTTLLHTFAGLRAPTAGTIRLDGRPLDSLSRRQSARRIGLLPQDAEDPFPATVLETVLIGRHPHLRPWRFEGPEDYARAQAALETVGLTAMARRRVSTLSGGERRRLALATLLCQEPGILLLDEPSNHLDLHYQIHLLAKIRDLLGEQRCALMSLHDVNLATRFCSHALLLYGDGEYAHGPVDQVVNCGNLERLYGHQMVEARIASRRIYLPA